LQQCLGTAPSKDRKDWKDGKDWKDRKDNKDYMDNKGRKNKSR
jgi:hypothetical protein